METTAENDLLNGRTRKRFLASLMICLALICMTPTASNVMGSLPREDALEAVAVPALVPESREKPPQEDPEIIFLMDRVKKGESISQILDPVLPLKTVYDLNRRSRGTFYLGNIRPGHRYRIHLQAGRMVRFEYDISPLAKLVIRKKDGTFTITREPVTPPMVRTTVQGTVTSSLNQAVRALGESGVLAARMADIFAWDIDFLRDIQPGDRFRVLVEKHDAPNGSTVYGSILAAEFTCREKTFQAFYYKGKDRSQGYYDEQGQAMRKAFLKAPLAFSRISSGFNLKRMHPVLKSYRPHPAVDYAAPSGTPVKTVGDGRVAAMGYSNTMGNHVMIRHANGYVTRYFHLSGFAEGLALDHRVSQGQLIGYVGQTGYATGPHLCFRMTQNGKPVNPLRLQTASAAPVPAEEMPAFRTHTAALITAMAGNLPEAQTLAMGNSSGSRSN